VPNQFSRPEWRQAPADFALGSNEVHVWLIDSSANDFARCAELLSGDEQAHAERFKFDKDRKLYTVAHAALRSILSRYLRTPAEKIEFATGANGKPRLASDLPVDLRFNLSHSGNSAAVALTLRREIGVDLEQVKQDFAFDEVAERFFTAREVAALRALAKNLQRHAFYQCWTSKEAFLKAKGTGLSGELDEVEITMTADRQVRIEANVPGWTLTELAPGGEYKAALVIVGAPLAVSLYRWQATAAP
jgi:4'-phosphopantetheinyl transferase